MLAPWLLDCQEPGVYEEGGDLQYEMMLIVCTLMKRFTSQQRTFSPGRLKDNLR